MKHPRITTTPDVMAGKPVFRGTRVTVEQILRECALGLTAGEIAELYPTIAATDVAAALAFAADFLSKERAFAAE
jgi:uncharacterized protein (DUF433 family)